MTITFTPALGETIHVSVPEQPHISSARLRFSAAPNPLDIEEFTRNGVKVQLWSDIPVAGRNAGEWGELDLTSKTMPLDHDGHSPETKFSLLPANHKCSDEDQKKTLSLEFSVPLTRQSRFSFTYRLVYPSGEITWLGQFGQNGTLFLEQAAPRLVFGEGWSPQAASGTYSWDAHGNTVDDFEVAKLIYPAEYIVWALGKDNFGKPKNASLMFFVPRLRSDSVVLHSTFVLSTSPDSTISLSSLGPITVSGRGSVLFQTYDPASDSQIFMDSVLSQCSLAKCRALRSDADTSHVIISSPMGTYPVAVVIVPLLPSPSAKTQVRMKLSTLADLLPDTLQLSVFSDVNLSIHFFTTNLETSRNETISFTVDTTGSRFLLTPTYNLSGMAGEWQVAITTPYSLTGPPAELDVLPTPPPSPRLCPLSTRSSDASSPSVPSVPDIGPTARTTSERSSITTAHPRRSQKCSLAFIKYICTVAAVFIAIVLGPLFSPLFGHVQQPVIPREPVIDDEREPLLGEQPAPAVAVETNEVPPVTLSAAEHVTSASSKKQDMAPNSSVSLFAVLRGGLASIVLRPEEPGTPPDQIVFELNGQVVECVISKIEEGISIVEFNSGKGGTVKVSSSRY